MKDQSRTWRRMLLTALPPLVSALLTLFVLLHRLIFTPGYVIYRDLFPGQFHYPYLWHPQGSFLALENYKFVTFTGIFLPLQAFGLDVCEKVVYASAMAIAYLALHVAGCAPDGLDQGCIGTQETLFVGVENRHQRDLR